MVNDPTPIAVNGRAQGYFENQVHLGRIGMHRMKGNAFGHDVVQAVGKISKGVDYRNKNLQRATDIIQVPVV